jgi:hypothetical protein
MIVPAVDVDWAVSTGDVVGAVIGTGTLVLGFTPIAVFAEVVTPAFNEMFCA